MVSLAFTIDRKGNVVSSRIEKTSGSTVLDAEALAMVKRAAPLPAPPPDVVTPISHLSSRSASPPVNSAKRAIESNEGPLAFFAPRGFPAIGWTGKRREQLLAAPPMPRAAGARLGC